jgi:hypothetical protein
VSVPVPKTEYHQEYYHSFRGNAGLADELELIGPDVEACVRFEPAGARLTLPTGHPGKRLATGLTTTFVIKGDFEVTLGYELLKEPAPGGAGQGAGLFVGVDLNTEAYNRATLSRVVRDRKRFAAWFQLTKEGADNPHTDELRVFPCTGAATGRLRLVRSGSLLSHYVSEGPGKDFVFLRQHAFGAEDVKAVRLGGSTDGPTGSLDARVLDLRVRADSLPGQPDVAATAPAGNAGGNGLLAVGFVLGLALLLAVALAGFFAVRRRRAGRTAAPVAVPDEPVPPAAAPALAVSFPCPRLRAEPQGPGGTGREEGQVPPVRQAGTRPEHQGEPPRAHSGVVGRSRGLALPLDFGLQQTHSARS